MPPDLMERQTLKQIAREFERIARVLRAYPAGDGSRGAAPAKAILRSLERVNATLKEGSRGRGLGSAGFTKLAREFDKIATTLQAVAAASKSSTSKR